MDIAAANIHWIWEISSDDDELLTAGNSTEGKVLAIRQMGNEVAGGKLCVWRIGVVSIRDPFVTRRQNPTGSQTFQKISPSFLLQVETSSETILFIHHPRHIRSVPHPGACQIEHTPLFEQLLQLVLVASTK